jgi:5-methylcytosine-specific restriction endonuclease McrA
MNGKAPGTGVFLSHCDYCRRLTWHTFVLFPRSFRMFCIVATPFTFGISLIFLLVATDIYNGPRCKLCATDWYARLFRRNRSMLRTTGGLTQTITSQPQPNDHSGPKVQNGYRQSDRNDPESIAQRQRFLNRPTRFQTQGEFWDWHDTLYLGGSWDSPEWQERARQVKIRDGLRCVQCGAKDNLQTDHIQPLSKGGSNDFDNLQTLCLRCHEVKTGRPLGGWSI